MQSKPSWIRLMGIMLASIMLTSETVELTFAKATEGTTAHPFFISVGQIDHNTVTNVLEMSFRIFTDDLEHALEMMGAGRLHLGTEHEEEKADLYIDRYLTQHIGFEINGGRVNGIFLGKEVDIDATWCYVEIVNITALETMTVTNTLLFDAFEDQINLVHVKANDQKKSLVFSKQLVRQTLDF